MTARFEAKSSTEPSSGVSKESARHEEKTQVAEPRFLTLGHVATYLSVSEPQVYALVRSGDLPAVKIGGRGVWRVDRTKLEDFIERIAEENCGVGARASTR